MNEIISNNKRNTVKKTDNGILKEFRITEKYGDLYLVESNAYLFLSKIKNLKFEIVPNFKLDDKNKTILLEEGTPFIDWIKNASQEEKKTTYAITTFMLGML